MQHIEHISFELFFFFWNEGVEFDPFLKSLSQKCFTEKICNVNFKMCDLNSLAISKTKTLFTIT